MGLSYFPQKRREISLPMDLVMEEILTRLPAKSLMRFKCVSKLWSSLIRSRYFGNRYLTVPSQPRPRLYFCLGNLRESVSVILSSAPDTTSTTSSSFVVDHDLTFPDMGDYVMQNFSGFMCHTELKHFKNLEMELHIYNPATRQLITLPSTNNKPPPGEVVKNVSYFFGHDPVNDQYKVVCAISVYLKLSKERRTEHWVFVLKPGEGSWKKVSSICSSIPVGKSQCINGVIYYRAYINGTTKTKYVIRSFNIRSEEFKTIEIPPDVVPKLYHLSKYVGKLTLLEHINLRDKGMLDFWVLEDAVKMEWSTKSLVLQPSQRHLVNNTKFCVSGTSQSGKVLFTPQYFTSPFYFLCYDLQNNDMRKIEIKGIPDHLCSKYEGYIRSDIMFMDHSESVVHLE